jgi:hypothetical protein
MNLRQLLPRTHEGYAVCFAAAAVAIIVASLAGMADAGGYRQRAVCNVVRAPVYQQAAVVATPAYYPVIGFQASQYLQQRAVDTYGFRQSDEYAEYLQLLGERRGTDKVLAAIGQRLTDSGDRSAGPPQPAPNPAVTEEGQTTEEPQAFSAPLRPAKYDLPLPIPPDPEATSWPENGLRPAGSVDIRTGEYQSAPFSATHPTLDASCKSCHESEETKGKFSMAEAVTTAQAEQDFEKLNAIALSILSGEMPKGKTISEKEKSLAVYELLSQ